MSFNPPLHVLTRLHFDEDALDNPNFWQSSQNSGPSKYTPDQLAVLQEKFPFVRDLQGAQGFFRREVEPGRWAFELWPHSISIVVVAKNTSCVCSNTTIQRHGCRCHGV